jgi:hypothetical protein
MKEYFALVDDKDSSWVRLDIFPCEDMGMGIQDIQTGMLEVSQNMKVKKGTWYKITLGNGDGVPAQYFSGPTYDQATNVTIISIVGIDNADRAALTKFMG